MAINITIYNASFWLSVDAAKNSVVNKLSYLKELLKLFRQQIPALSEQITAWLQNKFQESVARINSPLLLVIVILKQLTFPFHLYFCKYSCTSLSDHFQAFQWNAFLYYNRPFPAPWLDPLHRIGFPGRKNASQDLSGSHLCKKREKKYNTVEYSIYL